MWTDRTAVSSVVPSSRSSLPGTTASQLLGSLSFRALDAISKFSLLLAAESVNPSMRKLERCRPNVNSRNFQYPSIQCMQIAIQFLFFLWCFFGILNPRLSCPLCLCQSGCLWDLQHLSIGLGSHCGATFESAVEVNEILFTYFGVNFSYVDRFKPPLFERLGWGRTKVKDLGPHISI